jgi:hypothetical protein
MSHTVPKAAVELCMGIDSVNPDSLPLKLRIAQLHSKGEIEDQLRCHNRGYNPLGTASNF